MWTPLISRLPDLAPAAVKTSAFTHARTRLPVKAMTTLAEWSCREAHAAPVTWKGLRLRAFDGTTVSMPGEPDLIEHFGLHNTKHGPTRYPLARLVSLLDIGECRFAGCRFGPHRTGEISTARELMPLVEPCDLILIDRGFTGSPTMARIRARNAHFLGRKNARLKVEKVKIVKKLGRKDWIVELPVSIPARKEDPALPATVTVRLFKAQWRAPSGARVTEWFVTSLMDPVEFPRKVLAALYHERWTIETSYREFKRVFHSDVLRSKTVGNVYKEMAGHVVAYQLVRGVMVDAARRRAKKPTAVSFVNAARWVLGFSRIMAYARVEELPRLYEIMLDVIAADEVDVRPGRMEPRAIRREWKHYPCLRMTRAEWRRAQAVERN